MKLLRIQNIVQALTIATERISIDDTSSDFSISGTYALLTITNHGSNVATKKPHHFFRPFANLGQSHSEEEYALAAACCILQRHEGRLSVIREPDEGTTILVYIPLRETVSETIAGQQDRMRHGNGRKTILLAEDDESVRNMAVAILQHSGYDVIEAVDGDDALHKYLENKDKIQLLLFDLVMPKKSGKDAYDEIRKHTPSIKVLFATGYVQEISKLKKQADKNISYIFKPYQPSTFLQKVRHALET